MSLSKEELSEKIHTIQGITSELNVYVSGKPPQYSGPFERRIELNALVAEVGGIKQIPKELRDNVKRIIYSQQSTISSICPNPAVRQRGPQSPDYRHKNLERRRLLKKI
ncbi:MAG: hypothetical protein US62_C0030G0004 [Candidatus Woesebacteria bacterium GW2011_GWA1_37_8]|uniref:Uncharacterized protein n=2 Tax=Candidatus Woeseibacteriota TaxID=1752722 RepID=A0A0G0LHN4_9BACT|nr:MAG: hypothetical protein US62_C0030G0004 [Candidatus Woesebacteria bacterium GW2011_GWA1_37_8]KKQ87455.1 MAG: hypothetical protein UT10_C0006G0013 [Candidatus Woesebacteria bacterium GW2011_GWB1_38_8b]